MTTAYAEGARRTGYVLIDGVRHPVATVGPMRVHLCASCGSARWSWWCADARGERCSACWERGEGRDGR